MTKRRAFWSLTLLLLLGALALLLPRSPAYAPKLFARYLNVYDGHGAGHWTGALDDPDPKVRRRAIFALGMLGSDAEDAIPALGAIMVNDDDSDLRVEASLALSKLGPATRSEVPSLARALGDENPLVRINAARTLFRLGPDARPAAPALIRAMKAWQNEPEVKPFDVSVQQVAALALGRATAGSDEGVSALVEALEGARRTDMRRTVARSLGDVGACARPAEPQLRALLRDEDDDVRDAAATALKKIGADPAPAG
ncbi:MAG TPA: HEAT repeat domain-containing protein [Gemmataceae bacterium]|nr:HEAT repeat domain-containing protein [Gemmataceae bacterium]